MIRSRRSTSAFLCRRLGPADVAAYRRLRLYALRESPTAFGSAYSEEAKRPVAFFAGRLEQADGRATFGAFAGERLVGMVTLIRDEHLKARHKAAIYSMYVSPGFRREGIGCALITLALDSARTMSGLKQVRLTVTSTNLPARRLYQSIGFTPYGEEPAALCIKGRYYSELLLVLRLKRDSRRPRLRRAHTSV